MDWTLQSRQIAIKQQLRRTKKTVPRKTQTRHRIRLRLYAPNQALLEITVGGVGYNPEPEVKATHDDWYAQAWETEFREILLEKPTEQLSENYGNHIEDRKRCCYNGK